MLEVNVPMVLNAHRKHKAYGRGGGGGGGYCMMEHYG